MLCSRTSSHVHCFISVNVLAADSVYLRKEWRVAQRTMKISQRAERVHDFKHSKLSVCLEVREGQHNMIVFIKEKLERCFIYKLFPPNAWKMESHQVGRSTLQRNYLLINWRHHQSCFCLYEHRSSSMRTCIVPGGSEKDPFFPKQLVLWSTVTQHLSL